MVILSYKSSLFPKKAASGIRNEKIIKKEEFKVANLRL